MASEEYNNQRIFLSYHWDSQFQIEKLKEFSCVALNNVILKEKELQQLMN
jgi:hypothetical protein